ncbi:glycoside hydrolase [Sparassis latifolia]
MILSKSSSFWLYTVLSLFSFQVKYAANSFAGSNLYYAAGLYRNSTTTLLEGLRGAGMKALRVWIWGQSTDQKGTPINPFPDLEPTQICDSVASCYDDTVLERLDDFMLVARDFGIKSGLQLLITMHSFNALQGGDVYGAAYGIADFYTNPSAQQAFDARLQHILNHVHTMTEQPWKELNDFIFGFEAENEAMIGDGQSFIEANQQWQCDRATTIRNELGNNHGIIVMTGGDCSALDVISIHAYAVTDYYMESIQSYVQQAQAAGKKLIMEEWGSCYYDTLNSNCPVGDPLPTATRNANIAGWASNITAAGLPWLYWEVLPDADPHEGDDFEIGLVDPSWPTLKQAALAAPRAPAAFDFSEYVACIRDTLDIDTNAGFLHPNTSYKS